MKNIYLFLVACLCAGISSFAQPSISLQKSLGGSGNEQAFSMALSSAGGYVVAGNSTSNDGDVSGHHGLTSKKDAWVVALAPDLTVLWQHSYGGTADDEFYKIIHTTDGGYIAIGTTWSTDGDVSGFRGGSQNMWVVKLSNPVLSSGRNVLGAVMVPRAVLSGKRAMGDISCWRRCSPNVFVCQGSQFYGCHPGGKPGELSNAEWLFAGYRGQSILCTDDDKRYLFCSSKLGR